MSTSTMGPSASLTAIPFSGAMNTTDLATVAQGILNDLVNGNPIWPGAFAQNGLLYVPNRGVLRVLPGDYVGIDSTGWPVLVAQHAFTAGGWTHAP